MKQPTLPVALTEAEAVTPPSSRIGSSRPNVASVALLWLATTACGFPRPADLVSDASGGSDGSAGPIVAIQVSPSGDDANDGLMLPVKTLKHALGLASENDQISTIILATGTYSMSSGETFPYTISRNVEIVGPAGGGAILEGSATGPGMTVGVGGLQDLDLRDFTTAITATDATSLKNIRVSSSAIAVQAEKAAKLTVANLDVEGAAGACAVGIVLNGAAELTATTFSTRNLGTTLDARDQSVVDIAMADVAGAVCAKNIGTMAIRSSGEFALRDSLLDGGAGVVFDPTSASFRAVMSNVIIRNMNGDAMSGGFAATDVAATFQVTGCELSNNSGAGSEIGSGVWTFTGSTVRNNTGVGIYAQNATLIMRNSMVIQNSIGVAPYVNVAADLGTIASPGNNVIQNNMLVGISADSNLGVSAAGNAWNANVQGADANGKYTPPTTIAGPIASGAGNNFEISAGDSLLR